MATRMYASGFLLTAVLVQTVALVPMPKLVYATDELPKESILPLAMAGKAVQAAIEACKKDGYKVSVTVVDRAGILRTMGSPSSAGRSAACSASSGSAGRSAARAASARSRSGR